jgi:hypothetical protein
MQHINAELRQAPDIQERIGLAFSNWFQTLLSMAQQPQQPEPEEGTEEKAA